VSPTRIVTLDLVDRDLDPDAWQALGALGPVVRTRRGDPDLPIHLADADAVLVQLGVSVDRALLAHAPKLRYVGVFGTSMGRIDLAACAARGVVVRNVPGFSTEAVAELAVAITLDHLRGLTDARGRAARGDLAEAPHVGRELRDLHVGIVGMGAIGSRVASILGAGFGADVRHWSRTARAEHAAHAMTLDALLTRSEVVSVHVALTEETRGLLDRTRVAQIPRGALLVHLSPLELLDLDALVERLRVGSLWLATDHGDELAPETLALLRSLDHCILYPPIGYATDRARTARSAGLLAALRHGLSGSR